MSDSHVWRLANYARDARVARREWRYWVAVRRLGGLMSERGERLVRFALAAARAREAWRDAVAIRDAEMADAEADGWTLSQIATQVGLSVAQVQRTCIAQTARRQAG